MSTEQIEQTDRSEADQGSIDITLLDDEHVLKSVRPSWINWWKILVVAVIFALVGLVFFAEGEVGIGLVALILAGLAIVYTNYARKRSQYIVTNQRVKKRVGLARKSTGETRIVKIRGLVTEQSVLERLVGKGRVLIDSGAASGKLGIKGIANHEELANTIREQQQRIESAE